MKNLLLFIVLLINVQSFSQKKEYIKFNFLTKESGMVMGIARDQDHLMEILASYNKRNKGKKFAMHEQGYQMQWVMGHEKWVVNEAYFRSLSEGGKIYQVFLGTTLRSIDLVNELGLDTAAKEYQDILRVIGSKNISYKNALNKLYNSWQITQDYGIKNNGIYQESLNLNFMPEGI